MFCPSCGSNNQDGVKFCTRCGTNLSVVNDALRGKPATDTVERRVELLKKYYDGRRSVAVGSISLVVGLTIMSLLMFNDLTDRLGILALFALGCCVYGAIAAISGVNYWIESSSEMKALGYEIPSAKLPQSVSVSLDTAPVEIDGMAARSTDPISIQGSVTEQTTRQLNERASDKG